MLVVGEVLLGQGLEGFLLRSVKAVNDIALLANLGAVDPKVHHVGFAGQEVGRYWVGGGVVPGLEGVGGGVIGMVLVEVGVIVTHLFSVYDQGDLGLVFELSPLDRGTRGLAPWAKSKYQE